MSITLQESCHCHASYAVSMDYLEEAERQLSSWRAWHEARCPYSLEKLQRSKEEAQAAVEKLFGQPVVAPEVTT